MMVGDVITTLVSIVAIITTAIVALRTVNRAARQDRVTGVYAQMLSCVIETFELVREMFLLLDAVSKNTVYVDKKRTHSATAYERFYERGPEISRRFNGLMARHELLLPDTVFQSVRGLLDSINEAAATAHRCVPENGQYPEYLTSKLATEVGSLFETYKASLETFREHIGSNELTAFAARPAAPGDLPTDDDGASRVASASGPLSTTL